MNGDALDEQLYKYPGTDVLRNKLDIRDTAALEYAERMLVRDRMAQGCPSGNFGLNTIKSPAHRGYNCAACRCRCEYRAQDDGARG